MRHSLGYTSTSERCIEYQEALHLNISKHNYGETIVYTMSEGFQQISTSFGELINMFFSSVMKNLSFYQFVPLLFCFFVLFFFLFVFVSLLFFNYEMNFFRAITFRKSEPLAVVVAPQTCTRSIRSISQPPTLFTQYENLIERSRSNAKDGCGNNLPRRSTRSTTRVASTTEEARSSTRRSRISSKTKE